MLPEALAARVSALAAPGRLPVFLSATYSQCLYDSRARRPAPFPPDPPPQSLPTDFLTTMEEYVRDAPRSINTAKAGPTGAGANTLPSVNRTSSMARQGGTTSGAITGEPGLSWGKKGCH
eukprot:scaffold211408_cov21-Tisochrysis_lutea.AAC.1